jgi:hypothetical protein
MSLADKWRKFVGDMNKKGIPVPTARDPKTQLGSVSFSMVFVSFGLMAICVLMAIALVVNKWTGFFAAPDGALSALKEAFFMAFQMAGLSAGLYWGRHFQKNSDGTVSLDANSKKDNETD